MGWSTVFLPVFGNMHFNFLDKRCSPFLDIKGGYSPVDGKGGYVSGALGVNYQITHKVGINFAFGYTMQRAEFIEYYYGYGTLHNWAAMHHLGFKLGVEF